MTNVKVLVHGTGGINVGGWDELTSVGTFPPLSFCSVYPFGRHPGPGLVVDLHLPLAPSPSVVSTAAASGSPSPPPRYRITAALAFHDSTSFLRPGLMAELTAQAQPIYSASQDKDGTGTKPNQDIAHNQTLEARSEDAEQKARVDAVWQQMNKGVPTKTLNSILQKHSSPVKSSTIKSSKTSVNWMTVLGLAPKKASSSVRNATEKQPTKTIQLDTSEDAKKLAAAALSAAKDAISAAASSNRGKIEVSEVRDFAGEEIEVKKYVDASSKDASDKGKAPAGPVSAVDAVLEQMKKKQKLSVLDKTKKDWVEYKGENKGVEEELDAYKKSSNQYLDKVSFLQRADYREFERERDVRLAIQAKRKPDMREDF
ncbi:unnamed protein product [Cuscuta campestris]|uniref:BCNT-C domain-containing protein n=1 Tax=Cuscuta campestris TaxID=132261 RepID=A0A484KLR4_9ASTE|nr:unnamed protein product [Cuscuta campestris]